MYRQIDRQQEQYNSLYRYIFSIHDTPFFPAPTCIHFTSSTLSYKSKKYEYYNAPSSDNCCHPELSNSQSITNCEVSHFMVCPKYTPDVSAILRSEYLNPIGNSATYELIHCAQTTLSHGFIIYRISDYSVLQKFTIIDMDDETGKTQIDKAVAEYHTLLADIYDPSLSNYTLKSEEFQYAQREEKKNNLLLSILS